MFVRRFRETRHPPSSRRLLSSWLPWGAFIDAEQRLMRTRDDGYMVGFQVFAHDLESLPEAQVSLLMWTLNNAFKRLPATWAAWLDLRRVPDMPLQPGMFPDPVSHYLEEAHCAALNTHELWATRAYVFLWQRPLPEDRPRVSRMLFTAAPRDATHEAMRHFDTGVSSWLAQLEGSCRMEPLQGDAFLSVLYEPLLSAPRPIRTPVPPRDLHRGLAEVGLWPAIDPLIGAHPRQRDYIGCLSLDREFPPDLAMGAFRDLWRLPLRFRLMQRWIPADQRGARSHLDRDQNDFETSRLRVSDLAWGFLRRSDEPREDRHIERQKTQVDEARDLMLSDEFALGDLTTTFVVTHPTLAGVDDLLLTLAKPLQTMGLTVIRETYNTMEAFLSSLPGLPYVNVRHLRMTSLNLACLGPFHAPYQGPIDTPHLQGPVVTHGLTSSCMLARISPYDGDCADSIMVGPKGSGKSTLMAWLDFCQWLRYDGSRVMGWSNGGSFRCVALALGGEHYNLGRDALQLQILRDLDDPTEFPWILSWMLHRLTEWHIPADATARLYLEGNLHKLRASRLPRTLRSLDQFFRQHNDWLSRYGHAQRLDEIKALVPVARAIRELFQQYQQGGTYGHYVDADVDRFTMGRVVSIDPGQLLEVPEVYPGVLEAIFHRARRRRDGTPTRYVFDEAHSILNTPAFVDFLALDIPDWRRENSSGCFGTQALAQLKGQRISSLMFESSVVRYFTPNSHALEGGDDPQGTYALYRAMELHHDEIEAHIAHATPKCEVYMVRPDGRRRVSLRLCPEAQAICGANSIPAHRLMDRVQAESEPGRFAVGWLRACGFPEAAARLNRAFDDKGAADVSASLAAMDAAD